MGHLKKIGFGEARSYVVWRSFAKRAHKGQVVSICYRVTNREYQRQRQATVCPRAATMSSAVTLWLS